MEDEDEEEDDDADDGKETGTSGQGEMVNTSSDNADTMVDNVTNVLPEQGQEMHNQTPRPQPPTPSPRPKTPEPPPPLCTLEPQTLSGLGLLGLVTP